MANSKSRILHDVDVIIPCYNAGLRLSSAVDSVLSQEGYFRIGKIIIADDKSNDGETHSVLNRLSNHNKIEVFRLERRRGPAYARNAAVARGDSPWLAFLDADDVFTFGSLEARFAALDAFPEAHWIGGDMDVFYEESAVVEGSALKNRNKTRVYLASAYEAGKPVLITNPLPIYLDAALCHNCSTLISRQAFSRVGGYDERLKRQHDYHLFLKLALYYDFVFTPEVVMRYQTYANSWSRKGDIWKWRIRACVQLLDEPQSYDFASSIFEKAIRCSWQGYWDSRKSHDVIGVAQSLFYLGYLRWRRFFSEVNRGKLVFGQMNRLD